MNESPALNDILVSVSRESLRQEGKYHALLRENCAFFIPLSLGIGTLFALCFTEAGGPGLNFFLWSVLWCLCVRTVLKKLELRQPRRDAFWYAAGVLLGLSVFWTANSFIQFVSALGWCIIQCLWALNVFADIRDWHFSKAAGAVMRLVFRSMGRIFEPFRHLAALKKTGDRTALHVLTGLLIALPLAWAVTSLLSGADAVFRELVRRVVNIQTVPEAMRIALKGLTTAFVTGVMVYAVLCAQTDDPEPQAQRDTGKAPAAVAVTFTAVLAVIYLVFCAIQVGVLFTRSGAMLPKGYSYAQYAREGFFQLLAVSGINVLLVIVSQRRFASGRALKTLLCIISGCTYVMEISSAWRMALYVSVYGLTFLRMLVLWFLIVLGVILAGALRTVFRPSFRLFRFSLTVCLTAWLIFAFARPDALAARYDLRRFGLTESTLSEIRNDLSADALPELDPYLDREALIVCDYMDGYLDQGIPQRRSQAGLRGFNYSLWKASRTAEKYKEVYHHGS